MSQQTVVTLENMAKILQNENMSFYFEYAKDSLDMGFSVTADAVMVDLKESTIEVEFDQFEKMKFYVHYWNWIKEYDEDMEADCYYTPELAITCFENKVSKRNVKRELSENQASNK